MAENTAKFSPSADADANAIGSEIADNWVTVKARPAESMERQLSRAVDTINSLKDQVSQMTAALTNLQAHIGELEIKMVRLEIERECPSVPANSSKAVKREKVGYDERFRTNRELFAKLDADLLEILRDGK